MSLRFESLLCHRNVFLSGKISFSGIENSQTDESNKIKCMKKQTENPSTMAEICLASTRYLNRNMAINNILTIFLYALGIQIFPATFETQKLVKNFYRRHTFFTICIHVHALVIDMYFH